MPLSTYDELQTSILSWLARPGDPLVSPAVPDMIQLFEREATRRLRVGGAEKRASLTALSAAVALPADFGELRLATSGGVILTYVTPMQLPDGGGPPAHYTIIGNEMRLGPSPSGGCTVEIVYQSGVPPLSDANPSNWLLAQHPDCYLFGSLVEAESFIGSDDRIPLWAQRREAAFSSIESADRKARWGGAPLSIRAEGVSGGNGTAAGDWTSAPPVPIPIAGIVAGDGLIGGGSEGIVTVSLSTPVTIGRGGTGGTNALDARLNLGAAPLDGPVFTGDPQAPTPAPGDVDTSIATTGFVNAALVAQVLAGDVTGPTSATAVVRLQGHPVANTAPTGSQVLQWSGTTWGPASIAGSGTVTSISAGAGITVTPNPIVGTGSVALTVPVAIANGGTGSTAAAAALTNLGAAPLNAPVFTGDARAVTPATADNDTSIATTAYVQAQGYATAAAVTTADNLRVLKAGDVMAGSLIVQNAMVVTGAVCSFAFEDRSAPGSQWVLYANAGYARFNNGTDRVGISANGTINASNYQIGASMINDSGTFGFSNSLGPGIVVWGNSAAAGGAAGALEITIAGVRKLLVAGNGNVYLSSAFLPTADNAVPLGVAGVAWNQVQAYAFPQSSDPTLKTDIALPAAGALAHVLAIAPATYRWKSGEDRSRHWGFLAPDVRAEMGPDFGGWREDKESGLQSLLYHDLTAVLWRAVQELAAKVAVLEASVT